MGNNCDSKLEGKCAVSEHGRRFTLYLKNDVERVRQRYLEAKMPFAMDMEQFQWVTGVSELDARGCFAAFDCKNGGLVDAFEVLATIVLISSVDLTHKFEFLYNLFDFGKRGGLAMDEIVILLHSCVKGVGKLDKNINPPEASDIEQVVRRSFSRNGKTIDDEISLNEFVHFCEHNSTLMNILRYIHGGAGLERLAPGTKFIDRDFNDIGRVLYGETYCSSAVMDEEGEIFGRPTLFQWVNVVDKEAMVFIPDDHLMTRVCPGYFCTPAVAEALNLVSVHPRIVQNLFVTTGQEDAGRFTMQFFVRGEWTIVTTDYRILCYRTKFCKVCGAQHLANNEKLVGFCHSAGNDSNEIWMNLLEKGVAKLLGSYHKLARMSLVNILEMLTGGSGIVAEIPPTKQYQTIRELFNHGVVGLVHHPRANVHPLKAMSITQRKGFVPDAVYVVHGMKQDSIKVRLPASAKSQKVEEKEDSCFWIKFDEALTIFHDMIGCRVYAKENWFQSARRGSMTCAGPLHALSWYSGNQYCLEVSNGGSKFSISTYLDPCNLDCYGLISIAVISHDFGDVNGQMVVPVTVLIQDHVKAVAPFDENKASCTLDLILDRGKYIIQILGDPPGRAITQTTIIRSNDPEFSVYGTPDVTWQEVELARDLSLSENVSKMIPTDVAEAQFFKRTSPHLMNQQHDVKTKPIAVMQAIIHNMFLKENHSS